MIYSPPSQKPIGLIGLGRMGLPISKRLLRKGFEVIAFDISSERCQLALESHIHVAKSISAITSLCDIILVCVLGHEAVLDVVCELERDRRRSKCSGVLIDLSTTGIRHTQQMSQRLRSGTGMGWVDAPVSGGPSKASRGVLAVMAGGSEIDLESARPVLECLSKHIVHMGPTGSGQAAKMVNQLLALSNYCLLAEALELARTAGLDLSLLPKALKGGHADSVLLHDVFPGMANHDYGNASRIGQMADDLTSIIKFAEDEGIGLPVASQVHQLYAQAIHEGYEDLAGPALAAYYDQFWDASSS